MSDRSWRCDFWVNKTSQLPVILTWFGIVEILRSGLSHVLTDVVETFPTFLCAFNLPVCSTIDQGQSPTKDSVSQANNWSSDATSHSYVERVPDHYADQCKMLIRTHPSFPRAGTKTTCQMALAQSKRREDGRKKQFQASVPSLADIRIERPHAHISMDRIDTRL